MGSGLEGEKRKKEKKEGNSAYLTRLPIHELIDAFTFQS